MHRFGTSSKKKGKQAALVHPPAVSATTSATAASGASGTSVRKDVLQNASAALEVLKSVGEASEIIAPLKVVAGVLKSVIDIALLIQKNGGDMKDIVEKLVHQQDSLQDEVDKLSNPKFGKSDVKGLKKPLETYIQNLGKLQGGLEEIDQRYKTGAQNALRRAWKARSDQEELSGYTQKLQDAFQQFMNSTVSFIAAQTLVLEAQMREMSERMAEKDVKDALSRLFYADARGNQHDVCLEGTRTVILESIAQWADDSTLPPLFALVDRAGTGKSTVATHMARKWEKDKALLGSFFFAKPSTVTGKDVASTVATDIAANVPSLRPLIVEAIEEHPNLNAYSIRQQLDWIVLTPLRSLKTPGIIVIDALDECLEADRAIILDTLLAFISTTERPPVKLFLTCRPERSIISRLCDPKHAGSIHQIDFSSDLNTDQAGQDDIVHYANVHLRSILSSDDEINQFVKQANRLFIWASTARRFLEDAYDASSLLRELLMKDSTLNSLYADILASVSGNQEDILMKVLQAICVAREPLRLDELDEIVGLKDGIAGRVVGSLRSVLSDGSGGQTVQVLHPTFIEFLLGPDAGRFSISHKDAEVLMARGCLDTCITRLKYDICDIHHPPEYPPLNLDILDLEKRLLEKTSRLRYAAIYGPSHVAPSLNNKLVVDGLREFFNSKLLNWIELMSLYGKVYSLIQSVQHLKTRIEESLEMSASPVTTGDLDWCSKIRSMVQAFQGTIEESSMQVYYSALPFEPPTSRIARRYLPQFAQSIPRVICGARSPQSQSTVLCGHTREVFCIAYAPDGHTIASGSADGTVRLWDPSTGAAVAALTGHRDVIYCLAFSPEGEMLASGSDDRTVRLWDLSTGAEVAELTGHTDTVGCLAFSPDGKMLASGSDDCTVRLWDPSTGAAVAKLTGHVNWVNCLSFSPDSEILASGSSDCTVRLWDPSTGAEVAELTGHTDKVNYLTFSPDSKTLASGANDHTVRVWDPSTGAAVSELSGHTDWVNCLTFSPDSKMLASGSSDCTVRLWDPSTGAEVAELTGHTSRVSYLTFSPDSKTLASGSTDRTVRLWDPSAGAAVAELTGHASAVGCLVFSPDSKKLVSGSHDHTVRLWDLSTGAAVAELSGHTNWVKCLAFSPDSKILASGSSDCTVRLWDLSTGAEVAELTGHTSTVSCLAFSPDGKTLASGSENCTVRLWDPSTGAAVAELTGHSGRLHYLAFSPNNKMLASVSDKFTARLWNPSTGAAVAEITGHTGLIQCIAFSPDSKILASGSSDRTVQLWDASTGAAVAKLTGHTTPVSCLAFSPDNTMLASGSTDCTVRIWDSSTGVAVWDPLHTHYCVADLDFHLQNGNLVLKARGWMVDQKTLWNMTTNPPSHHSGEDSLPPTLLLTQDNTHSRCTRNSTAGISFQVPPYFHLSRFCSHGGIAAYGGDDGSIIIVDCSHLA